MRRLLLGVLGGLVCLSLAPPGMGQESGIRTSLRSGGELSAVAGRQLGGSEVLFGRPARLFASVGTTLDGGKVMGGGAALVELWRGSSFRVELGLGYDGKQLEGGTFVSDWDVLLQASAIQGTGSALSFGPTWGGGLALSWSRRW